MKQIKWFRNVFLLGATAFVLFFASCNQGNDNKKKDDKKNNQGEATQKFKVEFSLDKGQFTGNAELVAKDGTTKIKSGAEVEKGHTVTFEVTGLTAGYKVKWEGATEDSKDKKKATLKVEKKATVKAIIEKEGTTPTPPPAEAKAGKLKGLTVLQESATIGSAIAPITATVTVPNAKSQIKLVTDVVVNATDIDGANESAVEVEKIEATINTVNVTITKDSHAIPINLSDSAPTVVKVTTKATAKIKAMEIAITVTRTPAQQPPAEKKEGKLTELTILSKVASITQANGPNVTAKVVDVEATEITALTDISVCKGKDADDANEATVEVMSIAAGSNTITKDSSGVKIPLNENPNPTTVTVVTKETEHFKAMTITLTITRKANPPVAKEGKLKALTILGKVATDITGQDQNITAKVLDVEAEKITSLGDITVCTGTDVDGAHEATVKVVSIASGSNTITKDSTGVEIALQANPTETEVTIITEATEYIKAMKIVLKIVKKA